VKKLVAAAVSAAILAAIYARLDLGALVAVFAESRAAWTAAAVAMFAPTTLVTAWRFSFLTPRAERGPSVGLGESLGLTLAGSSLNMVLPSKMGDLAKAEFVRRRGLMSGGAAWSLVVFEKTCDMLALLGWCAFGLAVFPRRDPLFLMLTAAVAGGFVAGLAMLGSQRAASRVFAGVRRLVGERRSGAVRDLEADWAAMRERFRSRPAAAGRVAGVSVALWGLHLLQIWFFIRGVGQFVPLPDHLALAPLAILAGLMPLTFAGIGTRDAALIFFYRDYFPQNAAEVGAAVGLLATSRYVVPAIAGVPFLWRYAGAVEAVRRGRAADADAATS
jgi:uncharacterized membrane protein YbhN (UPF0104 family)